MEIKDLENSKLDKGIVSLLLFKANLQNWEYLYEYTLNCLKKAKDINDFINIYFNDADDVVKGSMPYAYLSREIEGHWDRVREMFDKASEYFEINSECNNIRIGSDTCSFLVNDGILSDEEDDDELINDDSITRIAIFYIEDGDAFNGWMMDDTFCIEGRFNIYKKDYDFEHKPLEILKTLNGNYRIYKYNGLIAFRELID